MNDRFQSYIKLVEFLGKVLGKNCEVVFHDIKDLNNSIIAISNGEISGRKVGGPATSLVMKVLENSDYNNLDYMCNYTGSTSDGKKLSSSTFFVRDDNNKIIGMLCINVDNEGLIKARDILDSIIQPESCSRENGNSKTEISELFSSNADDLINESIKAVIVQTGISPVRMSQNEKISVVRRLYEMGIYNMKGSVSQTSSFLKISEPSVYRYLNLVKSQSGNDPSASTDS